MTLGRAAILAFVIHVCLAFTVVFSFEGPVERRDTGVSYWGSIVRKEEFAPKTKVGWGRKASVAQTAFIALEARQATWGSGISIDKPSILSAVPSDGTLEELKFSGSKTTVGDEDTAVSKPPVFDLPIPTDVRLRYPRS